MAARRHVEYSVILTPSVASLDRSGKLLIGAADMAAFLGVSKARVHYLVGTGRIPPPIRLGYGRCSRWSVMELLEWVEAGCPRRDDWIEQRGWTGWVRRPGHGLLW